MSGPPYRRCAASRRRLHEARSISCPSLRRKMNVCPLLPDNRVIAVQQCDKLARNFQLQGCVSHCAEREREIALSSRKVFSWRLLYRSGTKCKTVRQSSGSFTTAAEALLRTLNSANLLFPARMSRDPSLFHSQCWQSSLCVLPDFRPQTEFRRIPQIFPGTWGWYISPSYSPHPWSSFAFTFYLHVPSFSIQRTTLHPIPSLIRTLAEQPSTPTPAFHPFNRERFEATRSDSANHGVHITAGTHSASSRDEGGRISAGPQRSSS